MMDGATRADIAALGALACDKAESILGRLKALEAKRRGRPDANLSGQWSDAEELARAVRMAGLGRGTEAATKTQELLLNRLKAWKARQEAAEREAEAGQLAEIVELLAEMEAPLVAELAEVTVTLEAERLAEADGLERARVAAARRVEQSKEPAPPPTDPIETWRAQRAVEVA